MVLALKKTGELTGRLNDLFNCVPGVCCLAIFYKSAPLVRTDRHHSHPQCFYVLRKLGPTFNHAGTIISRNCPKRQRKDG